MSSVDYAMLMKSPAARGGGGRLVCPSPALGRAGSVYLESMPSSPRLSHTHSRKHSQQGLTAPLLPGGRRKGAGERVGVPLVYGLVNAILAIPAMYGYAAVIFSHVVFQSYMPYLSKLVVLSSAVHQLVFTLGSTLPFSIGQVQDAGLIFLSAITTAVATSTPGAGPGELMATALVACALCTATLGLCLVFLGKANAAKLVSYLPMPVVGGYLAYIGEFCLFAGLGLSTQLDIQTVGDMTKIHTPHLWVLACPALLFGGLMSYVSATCQGVAALPLTIVGSAAVFYVVLWGSGHSLEDAREFGWVDPLSPPCYLQDAFGLFDFPSVQWSVLVPCCLSTWVGMVLVVSFSSCLDVLAIETDMGSKLDISAELTTVGYSNLIAGLCGGYTGSYIFSQTIFTYRTKCHSRLVGATVLVAEVVVCLVPYSVVSYVPNYFFAATLVFIAYDLLLEWLWLARDKMLASEYVELVTTFVLINLFGINSGLLLGLVFAVLSFVLGYTTSANEGGVAVLGPRRSSTVRADAVDSDILHDMAGAIVTVQLRGYLFFGTSLQVLNDVAELVKVPRDAVDAERGRNSKARVECVDLNGESVGAAVPCEYVVLDFTHVTGLDVTCARGCFHSLSNMCGRRGVEVVYCGVRVGSAIALALQRAEVVGHEEEDEAVCIYPSLDQALEACEDGIIAMRSMPYRAGLLSGGRLSPIPSCPELNGRGGSGPSPAGLNPEDHSFIVSACGQFLGDRFARAHRTGISLLAQSFEPVMDVYEVVYVPGDVADCLYLCGRGSYVTIRQPHQGGWKEVQRVGPGVIFGDIAYCAGHRRTRRAVVEPSGAVGGAALFRLSRAEYDRVVAQGGDEALVLAYWLTRLLATQLSAAADSQDRNMCLG